MLWRSSRPVQRKRKPSNFIIPSQPTLSAKAPTGLRWIHEVKYDGYRLIAIRWGGRVRLWSRHASDFTGTFSRIGESVAALPGGDLIIDGEAVVLRSDGHSDFNALRGREGAARAILVGFDLIHHGDRDLRHSPLEVRREILAQTIDRRNGLSFSQAIEGDGEVIFRHACSMGLEGIVSKRLGSSYKSGRCANWLKTKNPDFVRR